MNENAGILAIRALNYWRPVYVPSYLGLRLFLRQVPKSESSDFVERFLLRKLVIRSAARYREFRRFKSRSKDGKIEYRHFFAASPSSALGEAHVLRTLARIPDLRNRSCVFSYGWPRHEKEGRSYSYFYPRYKERSRKLTSLLRENPDYVVGVYDIRNFYPSVVRQTIASRLDRLLDKAGVGGNLDLVRVLCNKVLNVPPTGIPVGPALSHVFGNIALETVDLRMFEMMGDRYLRYVDDVFLVGEQGKVVEAESLLKEALESEQLEVHRDKYDRLTSHDWLQNIATEREESLAGQFNDLVQRLQMFIWWKPSRLATLQEQFRDAGLGLPLSRLALTALHGRFHKYMRALIQLPRRRRWLLQQLESANESRLLSAAIQLGLNCYGEAQQIHAVAGLPPQSMVRRLRVQRLRSLLKRSLYLLPIDRYSDLHELAPDVDEFFEFRSSTQAIITRSANAILPLPGPAASSFASLCREFGCEKEIGYDESMLKTEGAIDAVCTLAAFGVILPPPQWLENVPEKHSEIVRFCMFSTPKSRVLMDHSFEDELRTLQIGEPRDVMEGIISTRFSDLEQANLEALLLDGYETS